MWHKEILFCGSCSIRNNWCRYITNEDVVELKGKVACEISSADELTLTELMFSGAFKEISVEQMVALLSCFVWQEKLHDAQKPREELGFLFLQLQEIARRVATVQYDCKVKNLLVSIKRSNMLKTTRSRNAMNCMHIPFSA
jgi:superfamily II RNA helicase